MDFTFSETQQLIRETARKFAEEQLAPGTIERDEKEEFPYEAVKDLGELGFMGMMVPEEWGGAGLDTISYVLAMEEISRVDASCGVIMSVNNSLVCYGINQHGTDDQKERYLRDLASGKKLGAFALSEPEAGSDASNQTDDRGSGRRFLRAERDQELDHERFDRGPCARHGRDRPVQRGEGDQHVHRGEGDARVHRREEGEEARHQELGHCLALVPGLPGPGRKQDRRGR